MTSRESVSPPASVNVWFCCSCGHWTANSYMDHNPSNPDWRPRCKTKTGCKRPELVPLVFNRDDLGGVAER